MDPKDAERGTLGVMEYDQWPAVVGHWVSIVLFSRRENVLCLSRKLNERIVIAGGSENGGVTITVIEINGDRVRLGIEAPRSVEVHRQEVWVRIQQEGRRHDSRFASLRHRSFYLRG